MSPIPELAQRQIDRWCARCVPAGKRGEFSVLSRWRGRMVTLVAKRASERPFAQLRYGTDGLWTLYYWSPEQARWRRQPESAPENSPVPLLDSIDQSAYGGYFCGR